MQADIEPSSAELHIAYRISRLWTLGITYSRAITTPLLLKGMRMTAIAWRERNHAPLQPRLF